MYATLSVIGTMAQEKRQKYDVAAFLYPAYASDDVRLRPFWPMGIGEWETVMTIQVTIGTESLCGVISTRQTHQ